MAIDEMGLAEMEARVADAYAWAQETGLELDQSEKDRAALVAEVRRLHRLEAVLPNIPDGTDPAKLGWWCGTDEQWLNLRASIVRNGDKPVGLTADVLRAALEAE